MADSAYVIDSQPVPEGGWRNWARNVVATPARMVRPSSEGELLQAVRAALSDGLSIRVTGSGHSFSPLVPTDGLLLDLSLLNGVTGIDGERRRVRLLAGTRIKDLYEPLWEQGLALKNQGDIDHQALVGAVSTATHGSGIGLGSFSSALRWARFIDGTGQVQEIGEDSPRELHALATSLGLLGVIVELEIEVTDAYDLQEENALLSWQQTVEQWDENLSGNRHFSFFWLPTEISASLYNLRTPEGVPLADMAHTKRYAAELSPDDSARSVEPGRRRDRAYRIYPDFDPSETEPFHELEYYVPAERGLEAVSAIRGLMQGRFPEQAFPLEVRWVAGEESYLAPNHRRPSTVLSVSGEPGTDYLPFVREFDAVLDGFDARAHWGKIHFLDRERVERLYPAYPLFQEVRREFDPDGVFLNEHTRALFG